MKWSRILRIVISVGLCLQLLGCSGDKTSGGKDPVGQASPGVQASATPGQTDSNESTAQANGNSRTSGDSDDVGYTRREDGTVISGAGYVTQANLQTKAESGVAREFSNAPSEDLVKKLRARSNRKRVRPPAAGDMNAPMYDSEMVKVKI